MAEVGLSSPTSTALASPVRYEEMNLNMFLDCSSVHYYTTSCGSDSVGEGRPDSCVLCSVKETPGLLTFTFVALTYPVGLSERALG